MKWAVVVVSFNSAHELGPCLNRAAYQADRTVVVDNHSADASLSVAETAGAEVLAQTENLGFGRACNAAADYINSDVDWLVFVNPDVRIDSRDIQAMLECAPAGAAVLSPLLVDSSGVALADIARPEPTVGQSVLRHLGGYRLDLPGRRRMQSVLDSPSRYVEVPATSGACMAIEARAFSAVSGFDPAFFFNMEDVAISLDVAAALGGQTYVDTATVGVHKKASSSANVPRLAKLFEGIVAEYTFFLRPEPIHWTRYVLGLLLVVSGCARALIRLHGVPIEKSDFTCGLRFPLHMIRIALYRFRHGTVPRPNRGTFL